MIATGAGAVAKAAPTPAAAVAASRNWPCPPMLNESGLEADPDGEPAEDERRGLEDRIQDRRDRPDGTLEEGAVGDERKAPVDGAGR